MHHAKIFQGRASWELVSRWYKSFPSRTARSSPTYCRTPHTSAALCSSVYRLGLCHAGASRITARGSPTYCHTPHTSAALCSSVYRLGLCHAGVSTITARDSITHYHTPHTSHAAALCSSVYLLGLCHAGASTITARGSPTYCHTPHTSAALCPSVYRLGLCHAGVSTITARDSIMLRGMHGETQGGQTGRAWRIRLAGTRGCSHETTRRDFQPVAQTETNRSEATTVGSLLRCVHTLQVKLRGRPRQHALIRCASIQIRPGWVSTSRGSAGCNFFCETRSSDPIHHVHTHT